MKKFALIVVLVVVGTANAQQYLKCFRDEGGVLHEVQDRMPETPPTLPPFRSQPPPTTPPTTTTTTIPPISFNYTPQLFWRLYCPNSITYGPFTASLDCVNQRAWVQTLCPRKRVDRSDGFVSVEQIRMFRLSCGIDNGMSCTCLTEYH
jgi:hypothetical protein